jgi:hypothetical protein
MIAAAEIHPSEGRSLPKRVDLDTALVKDDVPGPSNGVATSDFPSDHVGSERDEIHARLQNLEVDLTDALKTLRSRFDSVLTDMVCIYLFVSSSFTCVSFVVSSPLVLQL